MEGKDHTRSADLCYEYPLTCEASKDGTIPNRVNLMEKLPCYVLFAPSKTIFAITIAEDAYTKAPRNVKSVVAALNLLTAAVASALGIAVSRAAVDPSLTRMYGVLATVYFMVACMVYYFCRGYHDLVDELLALDARD